MGNHRLKEIMKIYGYTEQPQESFKLFPLFVLLQEINHQLITIISLIKRQQLSDNCTHDKNMLQHQLPQNPCCFSPSFANFDPWEILLRRGS